MLAITAMFTLSWVMRPVATHAPALGQASVAMSSLISLPAVRVRVPKAVYKEDKIERTEVFDRLRASLSIQIIEAKKLTVDSRNTLRMIRRLGKDMAELKMLTKISLCIGIIGLFIGCLNSIGIFLLLSRISLIPTH